MSMETDDKIDWITDNVLGEEDMEVVRGFMEALADVAKGVDEEKVNKIIERFEDHAHLPPPEYDYHDVYEY